MTVRILQGDCREVLRTLPAGSVHCCVTSPPYFGLRDYGCDGQIGLEQTPAEYVEQMVAVFREVRRVLRDDGTLWLNLGDSYSSHKGQSQGVDPKSGARRFGIRPNDKPMPGFKHKDLIGIPWRVAIALQADGWWLRQDIIWHKPNPMPEDVRDRCTKAHEYIFLLSKSERYFFDSEAIEESTVTIAGSGGRKDDAAQIEGAEKLPFGLRQETRNRRSVWTIATEPFSEAHFATMAPTLAELCIRAGCPEGGTVLDPFGGAGTTGLVADRLGRNAVLTELNPEYIEIARRRIHGDAPLFANVEAA